MSRHVSLAMYDPGGGASAALWDDLRLRLESDGVTDVPQDLDAYDEAAWLDPSLLLSQTCGYPLKTTLEGRVRYVGTPIYATDGTEGALYRSAIVVRSGDGADDIAELRGRRAAYNSTTSQSGYNAFRALVAPLARDGRYFSATIATGSHANSLRAVIDGKADVAAIDPVTLALQPDEIRNEIKIIGWSEAAPGLPYVTGSGTTTEEVNTLRRNISSSIAATSTKPARDYLRLTGFAVLDPLDYDVVLAMEQRARTHGYPLLG